MERAQHLPENQTHRWKYRVCTVVAVVLIHAAHGGGLAAAEPKQNPKPAGQTSTTSVAPSVAAGGQVTPSEIRIPLRHKADLLESPQTYVTAAAGFSQLLPGGTVLRIAGIDMRLDRRP